MIYVCFYFAGYIRDVSDSYTVCIHVMTLMIMITFVTWSFEFTYRALKTRRSNLREKAQDMAIE